MEKVYINAESRSKIFEYLRNRRYIYAKKTEKLQIFLEAVYYMMRTGMQRNELPKHYGNYRSVHKRFMEWAKKEVWNDLLGLFSEGTDGESVMIDSTVIRAHSCAAGYEKGCGEREGLGRSKGGYTTKIHAMVDALGNPLKLILTPGQYSDIGQAPELIKDVRNANILADKGYDSDAFVAQIEAQDCVAVVPPRKNRKQKRETDYYLYKERHLIE